MTARLLHHLKPRLTGLPQQTREILPPRRMRTHNPHPKPSTAEHNPTPYRAPHPPLAAPHAAPTVTPPERTTELKGTPVHDLRTALRDGPPELAIMANSTAFDLNARVAEQNPTNLSSLAGVAGRGVDWLRHLRDVADPGITHVDILTDLGPIRPASDLIPDTSCGPAVRVRASHTTPTRGEPHRMDVAAVVPLYRTAAGRPSPSNFVVGDIPLLLNVRVTSDERAPLEFDTGCGRLRRSDGGPPAFINAGRLADLLIEVHKNLTLHVLTYLAGTWWGEAPNAA